VEELPCHLLFDSFGFETERATRKGFRGIVSSEFVGLAPGVDVMITIFCDFYPFSAKKLAFFSKTNVMITIFAKTSFVLRQKRQHFR
jgi:hypothetical protein